MKTRLILHILVALLSLPFFGATFVSMARWVMFGAGAPGWFDRALVGLLCGMQVSVLHLAIAAVYEAMDKK